MARWLTLLTALVMIALGVVFSALNAESVPLDLYYTAVRLPAGVLVLASVFVGCLLGGAFLYAGVILPLRLKLRAQRKALAKGAVQTPVATAVVPAGEGAAAA